MNCLIHFIRVIGCVKAKLWLSITLQSIAWWLPRTSSSTFRDALCATLVFGFDDLAVELILIQIDLTWWWWMMNNEEHQEFDFHLSARLVFYPVKWGRCSWNRT